MDSLWNLRPHQQKGLDMIRQSFREGKIRPVFQAACGFGKSVVMAHIVAGALDKGKRVLVIAPYSILIEQLMETFTDQGIPRGGVIQGSHRWTNPKKRLQVGTIQTLSRRGFPETDLILFDECHILYESFVNYLKDENTPVIAFSATPWTKGLGKYYDNLIQPISMRELMNQGYLSKYIAYAPCSPDMSDVKIVAGDYHEGQAGEKMSDAKITGSITDTWLRLGENQPTVCFATNVSHANFIGSAFDKLGVSNCVITAKTPMEDRWPIFEDFAKGKIKILINVGTLCAGFDADCRACIYAKPTKSLMRFTQCVGRILRTAEGKEKAILLDHSGTIEELGFPEDIEIHDLDDGENTKTIAAKVEKTKEEKKPKKCTSCDHMKEVGEHECSKCGFTPRHTQDVETADGELVQIKGKSKTEKATKQDKQLFWSELLGYRKLLKARGKHYKDGWFSNKYREKFGVWPRGLSDTATEPTESTLGWIKSKQIAFAKSKEKARV